MKIFLVILLSLLALCLATESKFPAFELCNRCQELARAVKLYRKHYKTAADEASFKKWVSNACERAINDEERELCEIDVQNIEKIWSLASGNMSPSMVCYSSKVCKKHQDLSEVKFDYQMFLNFKRQFNKNYTPSENLQKAQTFFTNLRKIERLNKQAEEKKLTTKFGITEHSDLSLYEFKLLILSKHIAVADPKAPIVTQTNLKALPDSYDWRTKGAVTPVKNQGQCGSCWSFSTTGNVEGQWFLAGHTLVGLSEQNLVDCDHECMTYENQQSCDDGCDGGLMPNAFTYIIKNKGIDTEASYPYNAVDGTCSFNRANVGATISNFTMISKNETVMAEYLVEHGPISIAADAQEWQFYIGGVFDFPCGKTLDHGILIVGYGTEVDILGFHIPFWWVKNSWGASWGESGYLKIKRGDCKCGLCEFACSSIV